MPGHADTDPRRPVTVIILAGGRGARMGQLDKGQLPWGSCTLLEHIVVRAAAVAQEVLIVGGDAQELPAPAVGVTDVYAHCGPLGGLHAGLGAARFEACLALGCDMPFVGEAVMRALLDLGADCDAVVPRAADGLHPLLAAYSRRCLSAIEAQLRNGDRRMVSFLDAVDARWATEDDLRPFDPDLLCFFNINTWQDYERALEIARAADSVHSRTSQQR
ncbi:MAG: molybdenum cofactor guanylyltransferase [Armatimonadota bacterium]|nr:MAG: molybdenum cofactor guanylyltransferase [Armatimonadota bacterium]